MSKREKLKEAFCTSVQLLSALAIPIIIILGIALFFLVGMPTLQALSARSDYWHYTPMSTEVLNITDTVTMVEKSNSWWGLGSPETVNATLMNGISVVTNYTVSSEEPFTLWHVYQSTPLNYTLHSMTFDGNYEISAGNTYLITYELKTFRDNRTEVNPLGIQLQGVAR